MSSRVCMSQVYTAVDSGTGVIQFFPDQLRVEGQREIPIIIQIIIVVTILLVAKVQLEIGIVFFTAVILMVGVISLAEYVQAIPHQAIASIRQDGNEITIESPELEPSKIVFSVNAADSQRLHGELHPRFAALLQGPR